MPNDITGDFDVVAEFSIAAANRILAAMHATERFPHSLTLRVDDNPPPGPKAPRPSVLGVIDPSGEPTVNHDEIGTPIPLPGRVSADDPLFRTLDPVVNTDGLSAFIPPVIPSKLQGRAQLQVFAPTLEVPDGTGKNLRMRLPMMSRYLPDPNTVALAEFIRGELQMTAAVNHVTSQASSVVEVDIKANDVDIRFTPTWSSQPLSAEDLAGVNQLCRNALQTSFMPANVTLPAGRKMQFKTLQGSPGAVGMLLNLTEGSAAGNPATMNGVFLAPGDAFAFAVSVDYLRSVFGKVLSKPIAPIPVHKAGLGSTVYGVSLTGVTVDLPGKIVVTITGSATNSKIRFPNFNFTARLDFTLTPTGTTADLKPGDVSVNTDSWWVNTFALDSIRDGIRDARNTALSTPDESGLNGYDQVNRMLSTEENLSRFLNALLRPPSQPPGASPLPELKPILAYTAVAYPASAVVLHGGWMTIPYPSAAHVEFEEVPSTSSVGNLGGTVIQAPEYSAFKTWIPGGVIDRYEWSYQGQSQASVDPNKFVLQGTDSQNIAVTASTGGGAPAYTTLCLTVKGRRLSWSGPVVDQPESVSATQCGYSWFPLIPAGMVNSLAGAMPMVALTQPGPRGLVDVVGHAPARLPEISGNTPNLIVHFADDRTAGQLELLTQALRASRREDAAVAVVAVLTPGQLATARHAAGVIYADEQSGAWARAFGVRTTRRPLTLVVGPNGIPVWRHEGEIGSEPLAAALRSSLARGGFVKPRMLRSTVKIGFPPPNFLFEHAPGRQLTLRKLAREAALVFCKKSSRPSIEAVRELETTTRHSGAQTRLVLAINDGEVAESARQVVAENRLTAIPVADPDRKIALAYGVNVWPTIVLVDALGLVSEMRYGLDAGAHARYHSEPPASAGQAAGNMTGGGAR